MSQSDHVHIPEFKIKHNDGNVKCPICGKIDESIMIDESGKIIKCYTCLESQFQPKDRRINYDHL